MKAKIFAKLKQEYSSLGLGDEVLMSRAGALAATGLVTDENVDAVVAVQRQDLEGLQKHADKRVSDALEKERRKREEETLKKAEEEAKAREAEESAKKKRAEEARAKAEEESKAKAEEEARKAEEESKAKSDKEKAEASQEAAVIAELRSMLVQMESRHAALSAQFGEFAEAEKKKGDEYAATIKRLSDSKAVLEERVKALADESEAAKAAKAKAQREAMILAKAKELGVPEWRINEGFSIADDASEETISGILAMAANNINTHLLPSSGSHAAILGDEPSAEAVAELAKGLVK